MRPTTLATAVLVVLAVLGGMRAADPLPPTAMPRDHKGPRPKPRPAPDVHAVMAGAPTPPLPTRKVRILLVAGKKDHGPGEHDYPAWQKAWAALFGQADKVDVATAWEWPERDE